MKAAAVAARLAQSIGNIVNEEIKLPEKIAGFINGRCGNDDELQNIQSASGCKIMLSRDSGKKMVNLVMRTQLNCFFFTSGS